MQRKTFCMFPHAKSSDYIDKQYIFKLVYKIPKNINMQFILKLTLWDWDIKNRNTK